MTYKKIECDEFDIHLIKNKAFHTIDLRVYFTEEADLEKITYRNFLVDILTYATKNYDTKSKLLKKCQDLYSLYPTAATNRNGKLLSTKFGISVIDSKYINNDNVLDNILLLKEIIFNPLVNNGAFLNKYFSIVKKELEMETKTIDEEPRLYAGINLLKMLDNHQNLFLSGYSDLEVLDKMDEKMLYHSYLNMLQNSKIDIFISGNIKNEKEIVQTIKENFLFHNLKKPLIDAQIINLEKTLKVKILKEVKNYQQSKLSVGFKLYDLTCYENRYVSFIFSTLLGGGSNSLLMRCVREEHHLCYYIGSFVNRLDNLLIINSGINKENYDKVVSLIQETIKNVSEGKFLLSDLERAKTDNIMEILAVKDSNRSIIDYYYGRCTFNSDDIDTKVKMIKKISKKEIMAFAKKILLDSIFFLKGDL